MSIKLGRNCKAYYNTGSYASPTWVEITLVRDLTTNLDGETATPTTAAPACSAPTSWSSSTWASTSR
jgi:hypothetical protein